MTKRDDELMEPWRPGSVLIRPQPDATLVAGRDGYGRCSVDPRTGHRFYRKKTGHSDPRGQFYLRDAAGEVISWGNYRTEVLRRPEARSTLFVQVQTLFSGSGRTNFLDPRLHGLGKIPAMWLAELDLIHVAPSGRPREFEVVLVDERSYWFDRKAADRPNVDPAQQM